jgi:hypothetical protein
LDTKFYGLEDGHLCYARVSGSVPRKVGLAVKNNAVLDQCTIANDIWTSMGGSPPFDTSSLTSCCDGNLIRCSGEEIVTFIWSNRGLSGVISDQFHLLPSLAYINLESNSLTGDFPGSLVSMYQLQRVNFAYNSLTGTIPTGFGTIPLFIELIVQSNAMSGEIPTDLLSSSTLGTLDLSYNGFSGEIPFFGLTWIQRLSLRSNQFTGSLPSMESMTNLRFLYDRFM